MVPVAYYVQGLICTHLLADLGAKIWCGSLNVSVFEFASGKGFDKSAHFNPQTCLSFRC